MSQYICHDFKTPRTDTSRRLPATFRVVPICFYLSIVAGAYFMTMDSINFRRYKQLKMNAEQVKSQHEAAKAKFDDELKALEVEVARAEQVAKWIEGTRVIQPISISVARTVPRDARINELFLERNEQIPAQLGLTLKLSGATAMDVASIENELARMNYRAYSPQQSKNGETIEYHSSLVWQER